jgi:hypothetical protein
VDDVGAAVRPRRGREGMRVAFGCLIVAAVGLVVAIGLAHTFRDVAIDECALLVVDGLMLLLTSVWED